MKTESMQTILVTGASGKLGGNAAKELSAKDYTVRAMVRKPERLGAAREYAKEVVQGDLLGDVRGVCDGVDALVLCAGANMSMDIGNRATFDAVDYRGNLNLLQEALKAGVKKVVYVSVFGGETMRSAYTDAHERFVDALKKENAASGLAYAIVRPTGFFSFMGQFVDFAKRGSGLVIGSGKNHTNPIHDADVAAVCVEALESSSNRTIECGGPETFTRQEIVEMAFRALGKPPRLLHIPTPVYGAIAGIASLINPRIGALLDFGGKVSVQECVASVCGMRRIEEYFREIA